MISELPVLSNISKPQQEISAPEGNEICRNIINGKLLLTNFREQSEFKNPLSTTEHSPRNKKIFHKYFLRFLRKPKSVNEIMEKYHIAPYGLYSKSTENSPLIVKPRIRRYLFEKPIGIRTYHGIDLMRIFYIFAISMKSIYESKY